MRDLLTVLAGILILVLVAALAVPPFIDWRGQRELVDSALSRATGLDVRTDGAIEVRLLPWPRIGLERVRAGGASPEGVSLDAQAVASEIALTPLLSGEVRFLGSSIERLELKVPTGVGGDWRVPAGFAAEGALDRAWVFEDVAVAQLLLTTVDPSTGRTEQGYAEAVRFQAPSLAGPWRVEGQVDTTRFTLATGEIAPNDQTVLKLSTEGEGQPRLGLDARLSFARAPDGVLLPRIEGSLRIAAPRAASWIPYLVTAGIKGSGRTATLDPLAVEIGEGGNVARLAGTGQIAVDGTRLSATLEGRRFDLDALLAAGEGAPDQGRTVVPPWLAVPSAIDVKLESAAWRGEELSGLTATATLLGDRLRLDRLEFTAPGQTLVTASGEAGTARGSGASGRVSVASRNPDRLAAVLSRVGFGGFAPDALTGRTLAASADVVAAHPVASLRNLRVQLGDAVLTGALRYTAAEAAARARLDAQLAIQGLDLDALPPVARVFDPGRGLDVGLILEARNVGYGASERGGRIAARLASEGSELSIDRLEIADLAGANANLSGRIAADGTGRIGGQLRARRAAPLVDLLGRAALGGLADLIPPVLRESPVDLAAEVARSSGPGSPGAALVTTLRGRAGDGELSAEITSADGRVTGIRANLSGDRAGPWLGAPDVPDLAKPIRLEVSGGREAGGRLAMRLGGEVAGLRIATDEAFTLSGSDDAVETGAATLSSADASPIFAALGPMSRAAVPVQLKARLGRQDGLPRLQLAGRVADSPVDADLFGPSLRDLRGQATLGRVSLPYLAGTLALGPQPDSGAGVWSTARFGAPRPLPVGGMVAVRADAVDLGRGLSAAGAAFTLATTPDGFAIREFGADFVGGRLTGALTVDRQGGLAAVIGDAGLSEVRLPTLLGPPFAGGRLGATFRFGGSGESAAALIANLGGAGRVEVQDLQVAAADPGGVERVVARALRSDDPLSSARLAALASEELNRAPFVAAQLTGQGTLVAGALRLSPLVAEAGPAVWQGTAGIDFRNAGLDVRGALTARSSRAEGGPPPYLALGWVGPIGRPARTIDVGPLSNGLAAIVLTRELDRIDTFELDAAERRRLNSRVEMDRARRAAIEEAARLARQRELEAERARAEAERARQEAERARQEAERILGIGGRDPPPPRPPSGAAPVDIRPPAQGGAGGG